MGMGNVLRQATVVLVVLLLAGCASQSRIDPEDTAGSVFMLGMSLEGRPVNELGYHYVFNFVDADDEPVSITQRPRHRDHYIIFDQLAPGDWELVSYAARPAPGVSNFAGIRLQARPVHLKFTLEDESVHLLSQQLIIEHGRNARDETTTSPRMAPLSLRIQDRMDRRAQRMGDHWQFDPEPIGELDPPERATRRSFLERLFGD